MLSSLYEIVELSDGRIGLRRAGEDGEPLLAIQFSSDAKEHLKEAQFDVAKAMIEAGLDTLGDIAEEFETEDELDVEQRILH